MVSVNSSDARKSFADAVRKSQEQPVMIEKHGQRGAVMISPQLFDRLTEAAEELQDISAFDASLNEEGENMPWNEVKAELGWV